MAADEISVPAFVFDGPRDECNYYLLSIADGRAEPDGCHSSPQGVAKAKRLIESINAIRKHPDRRYVMIRVMPVPEHTGRVNQDAIDTLNDAASRTGQEGDDVE